MRHVRVTFSDEDYEKIEEIKEDLEITWREYMLQAAKKLQK